MHTENTARTVGTRLPRVTIVVPARDEEANIDRCLRSLVVQRGVPFEIVVVDDGSTDRTREMAETFTRSGDCPFLAANESLVGVRVIDARSPLPERWTGKCNACDTGAKAALGEWLLFTDADTEHLEGSLAASVAEAEENQAAMLSYSPEQTLTGLAQYALMPLVFGELARTYRPRAVSDPNSSVAAANGQYILIRRSIYDAAGGFERVSGTLLEDVALARHVKELPAKIRFRLGAGRVRTRMYRDWADMQAGWTKNLALLFPQSQQLAFWRIFEFFLLILLPIFSVLSVLAHQGRLAMGEAIVAGLLWMSFLWRVRRSHAPLPAIAVSAFGLPMFAALLLRSSAAHARGAVHWKGRSYPGAGSVTSQGQGPSNAEDTSKSKAAR